ncbi:putative CONSERVED INTEGRAL MEMBRANE ALANINE AND LEUCINE RICH PROTEIN [Alkalibacterium sp. AK22]|uniref:DUF3159 domain-containing protein n=1 Tax=Alkalibacterium sp. AK22 TaxID=1229520 RepID=UPI000446196B|nr:DUF3159 domain-containing protein [Alkalibacterium sp. AK22]EXJ23895.1 putative CONSERVED INTEGRAL MEMBRANE ALANINE AND LEUCINE RICH PROTEIN [Alkalibacterium sp. AK22]
MNKLKEWLEQLLLVFERKTVDALFPPLIFFLANRFLTLEIAAGLTLLYIAGLILYRIFKRHTKKYVLVGTGGALFSIGLSYLSGEAINFYLPGLISTGLIVLACIVSLFMKRPLAALLSHLTRGWPIEWYLRDDIRPAYRHVTILWAAYFLMRLAVQIPLFIAGAFDLYFIFNNILGWPMNIILLITTYVMGIRGLKKLSGPSVEEFMNNKQPPYEGQQKGF